jgi:hypothetical protein
MGPWKGGQSFKRREKSFVRSRKGSSFRMKLARKWHSGL